MLPPNGEVFAVASQACKVRAMARPAARALSPAIEFSLPETLRDGLPREIKESLKSWWK